MKVLYLYMFPLWGNGSGAWLRRLIEQLATNPRTKKKFKAYIIAPESHKFAYATIRKPTGIDEGVFVGNPSLPAARSFTSWSGREHVENFNHYLKETTTVIDKFKPDLIHVFHTAFLPSIGNLISDMYGIPIVITTHGSDLYYLKEDKRWRRQIRHSSLNAKYITANSTFTRQWYIEMFGKDLAAKMRTIPAGVANKIDFSQDVSWIDKQYNFKYDKMVLFTGRLIKHKGAEYLAKAAKDIKAEVFILGDGPERPYLEELIKKYKLDNVHMGGFFSGRNTPKINDFYKRADIYVAPSVWKEPLGMVVLEAMANRTPVIVTRQGGVTSIVKDGVNGLFVRPRNSKEIAQKVNKLLADDKLREKMAKNAYESVLTKFSWEKVAQRFFNLYMRSIPKPKKLAASVKTNRLTPPSKPVTK